jgi:hypothetical protein
MAFKKGNPKPPNSGKRKGAKNEKTKQWESIAEYMIEDGATRFSEVLQSLPDEKFIPAYLNILEYFKPKLARQEVTGKDGENQVTEIIVSFKK